MKGKWTLRILGVTWGPDQASHCLSDRFTAPDWDLRGAEEEVLRLRLATCVTIVIQVARLRWPSTDWFSAARLPQSKPQCYYWFLMQHRKSRRSVLRMSPRIGRSGESMFRVTKTELLAVSVKAFPPLLSSSTQGHLKHPLMLSVRPPAGLPGYKCSLLLHFSQAIIEWRLRQGQQWMDSLVPPPRGWSSSE